jgi:glycosyltransferase involved in cell wall biosynthesis
MTGRSDRRLPGPPGRYRVGFVSTRFAGTDGVSLETAKWATVLERMGHTCLYFAGECDRPADRSHVVPEAFFRHPDILAIDEQAFPSDRPFVEPDDPHVHGGHLRVPARPAGLSERIHDLAAHLKAELRRFLEAREIDVLVVENASTIPLNLPLGLAISEVIAETAIPTIAHHHDFHWERQRFLVNHVPDILAAAFPPTHPSIHHVVINSIQAREVASRHGLAARVIPNVMEFEAPPPPAQASRDVIRADLGLEADELLILQPTRIIPRKGIEHAVEFTRRLARPARLIISHASGDEGSAYADRVREYAELLGVHVRFEAEVIGPEADTTALGRRIHALDDVYRAADFVTYPSTFEGFGNAFLEAIYYRRPLLVNNYSTYDVDIRPRGFRVAWFDGYIRDETVATARHLLDDPELAAAWADVNHALAERYFSFTVLRRHLVALLVECFGVEAAGHGPG